MIIRDKENKLKVSENKKVVKAMKEGIFPFYIQEEYTRLYDLASEEKYCGVWLELKDLVEVMLKFPVLLGISFLIQEDKEASSKELKDILEIFFSKKLSLGDWDKILYIVKESIYIKNYLSDIHDILQKVHDYIYKYEIIKWRNKMIGHGALPFEDSNDFIYIIEEKTAGLDECLIKTKVNYKNIKIESGDNDLIKVSANGQSIAVDKCIFNTTFFFNEYELDTSRVLTLDYINAKHSSVNVGWYNEKLKSMQKEKLINDITNPQKQWTCEGVQQRQELNQVHQYQNNKLVMEWLNWCLKQDKGVFLLLMDRGMGKTAFVSSINPLLRKRRKKDSEKNKQELFTRVYYCNALKYSSMNEFVDMVNALLRMERKYEDTDISTRKELQIDSSPKELVLCLKDKINNIREREGIHDKKILLIIDGIDEIYHDNSNKNIFDFIPKRNEMEEGVFILLTSRNGETEPLSEYTKEKIQELRKHSLSEVKGEFEFTLGNTTHKEKYIKMLHKYYVNMLENEIKSKCWDFKYIFDKVCTLSNNRFVEFKLYVALIKDAIAHGKDINEIITDEGSFSDYFVYLKTVMGEKQYKKMGRLLLIIATAYTQLLVEDCAFLERLNENSDSLDIIVLLEAFEGFIKYNRTNVSNKNNATYITLANERYREAVIKEFGVYMDELVGEWLDFIEAEYNEVYLTHNSSYREEDYVYAKTYIYAYITRYVLENPCIQYNNSEHKKRVRNVDMVDKIYQYEKFMPTKVLGLRYRETDIEMSYSCIRLLSENNDYMIFVPEIREERQLLLPGAYNSYIFHRKDIYKETWGANNVSEKAINDKENILEYCDAGIQRIITLMDNDTYTNNNYTLGIMDLYSKLCVGTGAFLCILNERLDEAEKLFIISYEKTEEIIDRDIVRGITALTQAAERIVSVAGRTGHVDVLNDIYYRYNEKIKELEQYDEMKMFLKKDNSGRVEYGILPRQAMLYRKLASVGEKLNWCPEGLDIQELYDKALSILEDLRNDGEYTYNQKQVIMDYFRVIYVDYGRYERGCGEFDKARQYLNDACLITEELMKASKLNVDKGIVEAYIDYLELSDEKERCSELYMQLYGRVEKWISEKVYNDTELGERFRIVKKASMLI